MTKWFTFVFLVTFAVYWTSNLVLWFPWTISEVLGMTLMLTLSPIIWAYSTYVCLITFPEINPYKSAAFVSFLYLFVSVILDYLFFGHLRDAMQQLYHPTTFYAYGFIVAVPFIGILIFKKYILKNKRTLVRNDFIRAITVGLISFLGIVLILLFE